MVATNLAYFVHWFLTGTQLYFNELFREKILDTGILFEMVKYQINRLVLWFLGLNTLLMLFGRSLRSRLFGRSLRD